MVRNYHGWLKVRAVGPFETSNQLTQAGGESIKVNLMPTYEYVCEKCKHEFEQVQSIAAKPLATCPKELCPRKPWGKGKVKRAISTGGGLLFKGTGFYITDYRSENYKASAKKDSASSSGDSKPASGEPKSTGDAKPAAKTETKPAKPAKPTKVV
jgi:putative FmdB family regulatory protein